ncbi:MAG: alpha/beta fold hydrolase [Hyphomicrobiales bacterium]|nr:alpha/beta fold hydrolase [Hyphomicrobiales bacterium]
MPFSTRNGLRIHYEVHGPDSGDSPPLVLVHANPFDRRLWTYQISRFSPFYRTIAVDLRGYGLSDKPDEPFTLRDMADDVLGVCADEGIDKAIFAGVSVGSGIALLIGTEEPGKAHAVILVGGSSDGPRDVESIVKGFEGKDPGQKLGDYLMQLMRGYVAPGFADTPVGGWLLRLFVENAHNLNTTCIANIFRARGSYDMTDRLPAMTVPTLVINGEYDLSLAGGTKTASLIPGAEHFVLKNTGHACCIEDPSGFDSAVIAFLRRNNLVPESALKHN